MNIRSRKLFTGPLPWEVSWPEDGRFKAVKTFCRASADRVLAEERAKGNDAHLYLGGMVVEDERDRVEELV